MILCCVRHGPKRIHKDYMIEPFRVFSFAPRQSESVELNIIDTKTIKGHNNNLNK